MTPYGFLKEQLDCVELTLRETVRHDYGPDHGAGYYEECSRRLRSIRTNTTALNKGDSSGICDAVTQLNNASAWAWQIEHSHLGEFSWPAAEDIRQTASHLLTERRLDGSLIEPLLWRNHARTKQHCTNSSCTLPRPSHRSDCARPCLRRHGPTIGLTIWAIVWANAR